jgi:ABC transporter substrate binding protein
LASVLSRAWSGRAADQPAVRRRGEGSDPTLDRIEIAQIDWAHLHPERQCRSPDCTKICIPTASGGIANNRHPHHVRRNLLEQFQKFLGLSGFKPGKAGGVVPPAALATTHRDVIIELAARYRLPAVYPLRVFVADGGLMSYGPVTTDLYPRLAGYIDRILKGEKAGDLPVQFPTKFELCVNLKTAKALGLDVPPTLLALANEVIK